MRLNLTALRLVKTPLSFSTVVNNVSLAEVLLCITGSLTLTDAGLRSTGTYSSSAAEAIHIGSKPISKFLMGRVRTITKFMEITCYQLL